MSNLKEEIEALKRIAAFHQEGAKPVLHTTEVKGGRYLFGFTTCHGDYYLAEDYRYALYWVNKYPKENPGGVRYLLKKELPPNVFLSERAGSKDSPNSKVDLTIYAVGWISFSQLPWLVGHKIPYVTYKILSEYGNEPR